jgi:hypothetical protein
MEDEEFRRGDIEIQWLERRLESLITVSPPANGARIAAIAGALLADQDRQRRRSSGPTPTVTGQISATNGSPGPTSADGSEDRWRKAARLEGLRSL